MTKGQNGKLRDYRDGKKQKRKEIIAFFRLVHSKDMSEKIQSVENALSTRNALFQDIQVDVLGEQAITQSDLDGYEEQPQAFSQERKEELTFDLTEYFAEYFMREAAEIDDTMAKYKELSSQTSNSEENRIEQRDLYTKLRFLADGKDFFENIGVPLEQIDETSARISEFLENMPKPIGYETKIEKRTQELGKETIEEQKDTAYIDDTEHELEAEERAIESTKDNTQSL